MTAEPLDDDYRMPLNPKPRYCSQCDNKVGEDETLCQRCLEDEDAEEADADAASSRIEKVKAAQKFHLLATHTHTQPEAIADHYTKLAAVAMQLRELVGMRHTHAPEMDAVIKKLTKEITDHHRADFGLELSWRHLIGEDEAEIAARCVGGNVNHQFRHP